MKSARNPLWKGLPAAGFITLLTACGGGGGSSAPPAAPAIIGAANAATITREVINVGLGSGSFGGVAGGGGILSADGGTSALARGAARQRRTIQQVAPSIVIPAETFDCVVSGTLRLSGSLASPDTLTAGDRISATFRNCDDADGAIYDGSFRLDITSFSGDVLADQYVLAARATLTKLAITEAGVAVTGDGAFDLDVDLTVPGVSEVTLAGILLNVSSGSDAWVLRDFVVTTSADSTGSTASGAGTLEGPDFDGAVDFATVVPFAATGDSFPAAGELLITGAAGATIRATVLNADTIQLAIDLDGDNITDDMQQLPWSAVGGPGSTMSRTLPARSH
jgi:hypothetical protein